MSEARDDRECNQSRTEIDLTDASLRAREQRLRTLLDRTPLGIGEADAVTGRCVRVNARLCEIVGRPREQLLGSSWSEWTHPDDVARSDAAHVALCAGTVSSFSLDKRYVRPDGEVVWVRVIASRANVDGVLEATIVVAVDDVTGLHRATEELRDSEARQRLAFATAQLATWRWDLSTGLVHLDEAARQLFAIDDEIVTSSELATRIHPDDAITPDQIARAGVTGDAHVLRRIVGRHGEVRWIDSRMRVEYTREGGARRAVAATVVAHDITAERRAQDALRASEERYRTLLDSVADIVFSLDRAGTITFATPAVSSFGYRVDEVIGRRLTDFVMPDDLPRAQELEARRLAGLLDGPVEYHVRDSTGRARAVRITTRHVPDGEELVGIAIDLTAMRAAEDQLRAAQRMEAVGRLAGGVAHDFNNLLTVIVTSAELGLIEVGADDPVREDLVEIVRAANRASGLTRQLLAFSRRQVLQPQPVQLAELVGSLSKMLHRLIGEDVELRIAASEPVHATLVDRGQMEQVVMNLVVNARDAMPSGGVLAISTDMVVLDDERASQLDVPLGLYVRLEVRDTGVGIDRATRDRIFEPFFTTKELGKGTGLGLATVYGIVKQSRGAIEVFSELGVGSTFAVYLPAEATLPKTTPVEAPVAKPRGHETILVVEDEPHVRAVVVRTLELTGYRALAAGSPTEAVRLAFEHGREIALIFTDVVLPEMNGRELVERLRAVCPAAKVLYTSGYSDEALVRSGVVGDELLAKPFDPMSLTIRIRTVLDG